MKWKLRLVFLIPVAMLVFLAVGTGLVMHHGQVDNDLIKAVKSDDTRAALAALNAGADPDVRDHRNNGNFWSIIRGSKADDSTKDSFATPLQIALNVEIEYGMGKEPPHVHGENVPLIKALLEHGADPNATTMHGTPLIRAAEWGYAGTLKMLLEKGADVNQQDFSGRTALHYAAIGRHTDCIRFLLDHGAAPEKKDKQGQTPLDIAVLTHSKENQVLLSQAKR